MHNTETTVPIASDPLITPETLIFSESKGHAIALAVHNALAQGAFDLVGTRQDIRVPLAHSIFGY